MESPINPHQPQQLDLSVSEDGLLLASFVGPSGRADLRFFEQSINARLNQGLESVEVRAMLFDLARVHPRINAAGRILDLACDYAHTQRIPVAVHMPAKIYARLCQIEDNDESMPTAKLGDRVTVRNVEVTLVQPGVPPKEGELERHLDPNAEEEIPEEIMCCSGQITGVNFPIVMASLTVRKAKHGRKGEVFFAEFTRKQFPPRAGKPLRPGEPFDYRVITTGLGETKTIIEFLPGHTGIPEDLVDRYQEMKRKLPGLDTLDDYRPTPEELEVRARHRHEAPR